MKSTLVGWCVVVAACACACSSQDDDTSGAGQPFADGAASAADATVPPLTDDECIVGPELLDDAPGDDQCVATRDVEGSRCCAIVGAEYDVARDCTLPSVALACVSWCGGDTAIGCYREVDEADAGGKIYVTPYYHEPELLQRLLGPSFEYCDQALYDRATVAPACE